MLLRNFRTYALGLTDQVRQATERLAAQQGRPVIDLNSSSLRKEDVARDIAERDRIQEGLVCVLTAVEPCHTFTGAPNRRARRRELPALQRKCSQQFYLIDRQLGWLHVRLQNWLPFTVQIVLNGRERLARQLLGELCGPGRVRAAAGSGE